MRNRTGRGEGPDSSKPHIIVILLYLILVTSAAVSPLTLGELL